MIMGKVILVFVEIIIVGGKIYFGLLLFDFLFFQQLNILQWISYWDILVFCQLEYDDYIVKFFLRKMIGI